MINPETPRQEPPSSFPHGKSSPPCRQEKITELLAFFSQLDRPSPENIGMCTQLGDRYLADDQVQMAKLVYRLTLDIDPENRDLRKKLAQIT